MRADIKERIEMINKGEVPEGYKKTKVGVIPEDWDCKKIRKLLRVRHGKSQKEIECSEGKYPILATGGVIGQTNEYLYNKASVLIGRKGTIDKPQYIEIPFWTIDTLFYTEIRKNINPKWMYYKFWTIPWQRYNEASGVPSLSASTIESIKISVPQLSEQQKTAQILSTWDKAIELKGKLIEQKKEQKKGLMQKLLTGEVRLPGFDGEWEEVRLGSIGQTFNGLNGKKAKDFGEGKSYITYKNIFGNSKVDVKDVDYVKISECENQNIVEYGDILFTTSSETPDEVGMSSVLLDTVKELYLNSFCFGFRLNNFRILVPEYARFLFRGKTFRNKIFKLAQGSTRFNLSKNEVMKLKVMLPSVQEQKSIAQILSTADKEINLLTKELDLLKQQKKGLMQLLLTGIVRVK